MKKIQWERIFFELIRTYTNISTVLFKIFIFIVTIFTYNYFILGNPDGVNIFLLIIGFGYILNTIWEEK